jgi:hypothetical protein
MLQVGRSLVRFPMRSLDFFQLPNLSSRTMALGSIQRQTGVSTRHLRGEDKGRPARKADSLTAICEPVVKKMWEPRVFTTLWAFKASYRDNFTFFLPICVKTMKRSKLIILCKPVDESLSLRQYLV